MIGAISALAILLIAYLVLQNRRRTEFADSVLGGWWRNHLLRRFPWLDASSAEAIVGGAI